MLFRSIFLAAFLAPIQDRRPERREQPRDVGGGHPRLEGIDVPLGAPPATYREIAGRLRGDPNVAGALITSHKIATYEAAADLLDATDDLATLCGEVGCVSRASGLVIGHALDPLTSMAALDRLAPTAHWEAFPNARVACLGAGGAGVAIGVGLANRLGRAPGPAGFVVVDREVARVNHARTTLSRVGAPEAWATGATTGGDSTLADAIVSSLPPGSVVVNATGLGQGVASMLGRLLGPVVHPFVFTVESKSRLGFGLLAAVNAGRLKLYAADGSPEQRECLLQLEHTQAEYRAGQRLQFYVDERDGHDDFVMSLALAVEKTHPSRWRYSGSNANL